MHRLHSLKDVSTFSTFKLRKKDSDGEVLDWLNIIRKGWHVFVYFEVFSV